MFSICLKCLCSIKEMAAKTQTKRKERQNKTKEHTTSFSLSALTLTSPLGIFLCQQTWKENDQTLFLASPDDYDYDDMQTKQSLALFSLAAEKKIREKANCSINHNYYSKSEALKASKYSNSMWCILVFVFSIIIY